MAENPFPSLPNDPNVSFNQGGSYQNNVDLESYYKAKSQAYADDIDFLDSRLEEIGKLDRPLVARAAIPDRLLAESVKEYNETCLLIKSLGDEGVSCGCSMTLGFGFLGLTTFFIDLKEVRADRLNLNSGNYSGGEPLNDNGDIIIIDSTSINTANLGDGQDTTVSVGASVSYYTILNGNEIAFPPSCGNCQDLYDAQQAAFSKRASLDPVELESQRASEASAIKAEREELLKERWTLIRCKGETETRKSQVDSFLGSQNYSGA